MSSVNSAADALIPRMASLSIGSTPTVTPTTDPSPRVSPLTLPTTDPHAAINRAYDDAISRVKAEATAVSLSKRASLSAPANEPAFGALDTDVPIPKIKPHKPYGTITPVARHHSVMDLSDSKDDKRNPHYVVSTVDADGKRTITVVPIDFSNPTTKASSTSVRSAERTIVQSAKCECGDTTSHDLTVQSREIYRRNYIRVTRYSDVVKGTKGTRLTNIKKK